MSCSADLSSSQCTMQNAELPCHSAHCRPTQIAPTTDFWQSLTETDDGLERKRIQFNLAFASFFGLVRSAGLGGSTVTAFVSPGPTTTSLSPLILLSIRR